jgi:hypothetical protein
MTFSKIHKWLVMAGIAISISGVSAQHPVPSPVPPTYKLTWDHDGINVSQWTVTIDDGLASGVVPTPMGGACALDGTICSWQIPFPALTPGTHTLRVSACNVAGCGVSEPFAVVVVVVPGPPVNLRFIIE